MSNKLMIAVSGKSGCGNTSVSRIMAKNLGLRFINYTFHNYAEELGIPFEELLARAKTDSSYDLELDRKQIELAREGGCVLGSRLAIWLLKEANLKVYLTASPEKRAERIAKREKRKIVDVLEETIRRDANDRARFLKLYNIDNDDYQFADCIVDTEKGDENYVAERILSQLAKKI
jgi:cytidylate kinase